MPDDSTPPVLAAALAFHAAGCCIVPARADGSKRPIQQWKHWQYQRPDLDMIHTWFDNGHPGLGVVCGAISGNLVMAEFEGRAVRENRHRYAAEIAIEKGAADVWRRVNEGYKEMSPSGGIHFLYRISDGPAPENRKLARRPAFADELEDNPDEKIKVLAEIKAEGGYTIVAPSGRTTHPDGRPWTLLNGGPETIPYLTVAEHEKLCSVLKALDEMPQEEPWQGTTWSPANSQTEPSSGFASTVDTSSPSGDLRPGDDFNQRVTWNEILEPHGWQLGYVDRDKVSHWTRPGKNVRDGTSATTSYGGDRGDFFYVWTSNTTEFAQEHPYNKFRTYAALNHQGDESAAARELRRLGYGSPTNSLSGPLQPFTIGETWNAAPAANPTPPAAAGAPTATASSGTTPPPAPADDLEAKRAIFLANEVETLRLRRQAKKVIDAEEATASFREPPSLPNLTAELLLPDEPVQYTVDKLLPVGGNVLLTAGFKVGKTTLCDQLLRSLADGHDFLGKFTVRPAGNVAIFNYEVGSDQYRAWLREVGIANTDRVSVLNLRGYRLPIIYPHIEDWTVAWLQDHEVSTWIVDPFARAFTGCGDENSNTDAGIFLDALDVIKERAGVVDLIMPAHTGRAIAEEGQERARGATRLDDWADVRWMLTKDDQGVRYFSAMGRDVEVDEEKLSFDEATRGLRMGGGDRNWERRKRTEDAVLDIIVANPGCGLRQIREKTREALEGATHGHIDAAVESLKGRQTVRVDEDGPGKPHCHYAFGAFTVGAK